MELRELIRLAKKQGWTVARNGKGHPVFWAPGANPDERPTVTASGTPSDHRSMLNLIATLRREGLDVPHRGRNPKKGP